MIDVMLVTHVAAITEIQLRTLNTPPPRAQNTLHFA